MARIEKRFVLRKAISFIEFIKQHLYALSRIEKPTLIIFTLIFAYGIIFSYYSILRHYAFQTDAWDLGIYNQALWTTRFNGKFFYETPDLLFNPTGSFFGVHFSPILILILPLYALWPCPEMLLIMQSWAIALSALFLFKLASHELRSPVASILLTAAYLMYPPLHGVNMFDFHVQAFIPLLAFAAFYYMKKGSWKKYVISILLLLSTIEFAAFIVFFFGLYAALNHCSIFKRMLRGALPSTAEIWRMKVPIFTLLISVGCFFAAMNLKNQFNPYTSGVSPYWPFLGSGNNLAMILTNPNVIFTSLTFEWPVKIYYLLMLFGPVSFISLSSPSTFLLTIPWLAASLLSNYGGYYSAFDTQYPAFIAPFIFISAIYGLKKISAGNIISIRRLSILIFLISLLFFVNFSRLGPMSKYSMSYRSLEIDEHDILLREIIKLVPEGSCILTHREVFPHVSGNPDAYAYIPSAETYFPHFDNVYKNLTTIAPPEIDTILIDINSPYYFGLPFPAVSSVVPTIMDEGKWGTLASIDGIMLFKKDYEGSPSIFLPYVMTYTPEQLILKHGEIIDDSTSSTGKSLLHTISEKSNTPFWYGPYRVIPPGDYVAEFRLKVNSIPKGDLITLDVSYDVAKKILNSTSIYGKNFIKTDTWQTFNLKFHLDKPVPIELRGTNAANSTNIYLESITVQQTAPLTLKK